MRKNFKVFLIFLGCILLRLIPLRAPNVEPIMASIMPVGKRYGAIIGFLFGFLSIFLYDSVTHFGSWTWIAGITYGLVGAVSTFYFKKYKSSAFNFVVFAIFATIFYDLITGVLFAPMFHQTMLSALVLQIPFTALHLAGNIGFALTISPILSKWLSTEKVMSLKPLARTVLVK
jgi:uncharacterized membrane protein